MSPFILITSRTLKNILSVRRRSNDVIKGILYPSQNLRCRKLATAAVANDLAISSYSAIEDQVRKPIVAIMDELPYHSTPSITESFHIDYSKPTLDPNKTYVLQVKGVTTRQCRGAGIGLVLIDSLSLHQRIIWSGGIYVSGYRISFEAEYSAIILGMDYLINVMGVQKLILQCSYNAVVNQITGTYDAKKPSLQILLQFVNRLKQKLNEFAIQHISPSQMSIASTLADRALFTRKAYNIIENENWKTDVRDPIQESLVRRVHRFEADSPAQSSTIDPSESYLLRFDGGAREYGVAGAGMVIYEFEQKNEIWSGFYFHDDMATNNVAEYLGLVYGLKCARSLGIRRLVVEGDSLLIVRQMKREFSTREESLVILRDEARNIRKCFDFCEIKHIPRAENKRADWLAGYAMDKEQSYGFSFIE